MQNRYVGAEDRRPRLLAIVGPTAVGKTDLAMRIASRSEVEIVGADSRQVYRHMDIGTAKPTPAQLSAVPHHLIDIIYPDDDFSLVTFLYLSKKTIANVNIAGKTSILVGGTGQYVMALLENWNVPLVPPDPALRRELNDLLKSQGIDSLLSRLKNLAPDALGRIDAANPRRVIRAIEIAEALGSAPNAPARLEPWFDSLVIGLGTERARLYRRADHRVDRMMDAGFLDEVERLLAMGYAPSLPSMSGIGYHELTDHLLNGADLSDAVQKTKFRTHRYIRRQFNWFRPNDPRIRWFDATQLDSAVEYAVKWIRQRSDFRARLSPEPRYPDHTGDFYEIRQAARRGK